MRAGLGAGLGFLFAGCNEAGKASALPGVPWPDIHARPTPGGSLPKPADAPVPDGLGPILGRSQWAGAAPIRDRINPMNGISRITLHHEGSPGAAITFTDIPTTAQRIEMDRKFHLERGWGDIGYHFIIDRSGRVWEGRSLAYQGAHVKDNNPHNVGIMCLGNFDIQQPTQAQLDTLARFTRAVRQKYKVNVASIHTHRELGPTSCPGSALQPKIASMRSRGAFT